MATCPHCLGPLTDDHQCPRERALRSWQLAGCTIGGGVLGFIVMALVDPAQRSTNLDIWVIALGAVMGAASYRFLAHAR
jgi:hypothetical protein